MSLLTLFGGAPLAAAGGFRSLALLEVGGLLVGAITNTATAGLDTAVLQAQAASTSLSAQVAVYQVSASLDANIVDAAAGGFLSLVAMEAGGAGASVATAQTATTSLGTAVRVAQAASSSLDTSVFAGGSASTALQAAVQVERSASATLSAHIGQDGGFFSLALLDAGGIGSLSEAKLRTASLSAVVEAPRTASATINLHIDPQGDPWGGFLSAALPEAGGLHAVGPVASQPRTRDDGVPGAWYLDPGFASTYAHVPLGMSVAARSAFATGNGTASLDAAVQAAVAATAQLGAATQQEGIASAALGAYVEVDTERGAQLDAAVQAAATAAASLEAVLLEQRSATASATAAVQLPRGAAAWLNAHITDAQQVLASLQAAVLGARSTSAVLGVSVQRAGVASMASLGAYVQGAPALTVALSAYVQGASALAEPRLAVRAGGGRRSASTGGRRTNTSGGSRR